MFGYGTWIWHGEQVTEQTTGPDQPEIPKLDKKKSLIAGAITIVTLVIVFAGILPKLGNYSDAWDSVQAMNNVDKAALIVAIIVNIWVYVFPSWRPSRLEVLARLRGPTDVLHDFERCSRRWRRRPRRPVRDAGRLQSQFSGGQYGDRDHQRLERLHDAGAALPGSGAVVPDRRGEQQYITAAVVARLRSSPRSSCSP